MHVMVEVRTDEDEVRQISTMVMDTHANSIAIIIILFYFGGSSLSLSLTFFISFADTLIFNVN